MLYLIKAKEKRNEISGGGGIRTPDTREGMPVFKTGAFNRSATPPFRTRHLKKDLSTRLCIRIAKLL